jgi:hypothetical protein
MTVIADWNIWPTVNMTPPLQAPTRVEADAMAEGAGAVERQQPSMLR